jgi:hypothetical protein
MATTLNDRKLKEVCLFFFGDSRPVINNRVRKLAAKVLHEAIAASKALDLVPRPAAVPPGIGWLMNQAVQAFIRYHLNDRIYVIVRITIRLRYKSAYEIAKRGM